jgi:hypothetical protein
MLEIHIPVAVEVVFGFAQANVLSEFEYCE